jgi:hypothetical protein
VRRAYAPGCAREVFFGGKEEGKSRKQKVESRNRKTRFGLNSDQTWAVKGRLRLGGDSGKLPKSLRERRGCTRAKQAGYTGGLPEIYRKFTGGIPEHHQCTTLPPRSAQRLPQGAYLFAGAIEEPTVNHRFE